MSQRSLSAADLSSLAGLSEKYGRDNVMDALRSLPSAMGKKVGRPPSNVGNLAAVYAYVEFHRNQRRAGSEVGIVGACRKLKQTLDKWTVNCRISAARLRSMYYEARSRSKSDPEFARFLKLRVEGYGAYNGLPLPLLLMKNKAGELESPIIDARGKGGRPASARPKIAS
jgi:hypothetical protein